MTEKPKHLAFVSPQGTMVLKDDLYLKHQGSTAENGGQIIYVIEMARAMVQAGHTVDIFARNYESKTLEVETEPGIRVFHVPTRAPNYVEKEHFYPYYPEYLAGMSQVVDEYGDRQYDAIVGHYADGMVLGAALEKYIEESSQVSVPLMGITHSLAIEKAHSMHMALKKSTVPDYRQAFNDSVQKFNIKARLGCELAALAQMDGMACVSQSHMKILFDDYNYPEDQMAIIPGGINDAVFHPMDDVKKSDMVEALAASRPDLSPKTVAAINDGKIVFGFGRLVKAKGIINAVEAMGHILKDQPDTVYLYAGGNIPPKTEEERHVYESAMEHAINGGYADRIVFLGRQDQKDIAKWLAVSDVYLHAATLEPFGLAPQEAAATGIPTVISKYAGVAEVLQNNMHTLHTDAHTPTDIAKQVGRILDNPALGKRLSSAAVEYIDQNATWSARARHVVDFLVKEVEPRYFERRAQRDINGNAYDSLALMAIKGDGHNQINVGTLGLEPELASRTDQAARILTDMMPVGLPVKDNNRLDLNFEASL